VAPLTAIPEQVTRQAVQPRVVIPLVGQHLVMAQPAVRLEVGQHLVMAQQAGGRGVGQNMGVGVDGVGQRVGAHEVVA